MGFSLKLRERKVKFLKFSMIYVDLKPEKKETWIIWSERLPAAGVLKPCTQKNAYYGVKGGPLPLGTSNHDTQNTNKQKYNHRKLNKYIQKCVHSILPLSHSYRHTYSHAPITKHIHTQTHPLTYPSTLLNLTNLPN